MTVRDSPFPSNVCDHTSIAKRADIEPQIRLFDA
ncbi:hypothetical protein GGP72_000133 [Salinibacter ruber]|uniref:Uncharacterized protein n=1 Tax=Salinibacter ruber TaxID=146919 RepID=A0A9X2PT01_9BACT|nr:hypothetical protein [Salinibacter ruber]MCS3679524.1 hypothetical protein [Salinibacter ruber]MCS4178469.1 hypothetical protein [Salinibacter ruber]